MQTYHVNIKLNRSNKQGCRGVTNEQAECMVEGGEGGSTATFYFLISLAYMHSGATLLEQIVIWGLYI